MEMKFVCINNEFDKCFTIGKTYVRFNHTDFCTEDGKTGCYMIDDNGIVSFILLRWFIELKEYRKKKLERILSE